MKPVECPYEIMLLNSQQLIIPESYQRQLRPRRVDAIVSDFDERIANEPKVSCRNGRYYVFDGQHTIDARVAKNGGHPCPSGAGKKVTIRTPQNCDSERVQKMKQTLWAACSSQA